jgi:hypothetical protein
VYLSRFPWRALKAQSLALRLGVTRVTQSFFWENLPFDKGKKGKKREKKENHAQKVRTDFLRLTPKPGGLSTCVLCEPHNLVSGEP